MSLTPRQSDDLLFYDLKSGNEKAFTYFFKKYNGALVGFCLTFLYDKDQSTSIAQEAFISLWQNKDKLETVNGIKSFLYTAAKSKCLNVLRHEKVVTRYKSQTLLEKERQLNIEVLNSFEFDSLTFKELQESINKAIEDLPETTKTVFKKSRFENMKNKDIALDMKISIKTVEAHMTKAIKVLKSKLSDMHFILLFI